MITAIRSQANPDQERHSEEASLDCSNMPDMARQEYKDEADINVILKRFAVGQNLQQRQPVYSAIDFDMDLQQAFAAVDQARAAHASMPAELRTKYPTWQQLLNALYSGEIELTDRPPAPPAEPPNPA